MEQCCMSAVASNYSKSPGSLHFRAAVRLLTNKKVAHLPELVNPDQPPFWNFAGSESFTYYESNIKQLNELEWDYLHGTDYLLLLFEHSL